MLIDQDRAADDGYRAGKSHLPDSPRSCFSPCRPGIPLMEQAYAADALKSYPNRPIRLIAPRRLAASTPCAHLRYQDE
jgi:hypothetical protein